MSHKRFEGFILEDFAEHEVQEFADTPIPKFLLFTYAILPVWGLCWWLWFSDGSTGFLDRGYWQDLQKAANTTKVKSSMVQGAKITIPQEEGESR